MMEHWDGCKCKEFREDVDGHRFCACCGLRDRSNEGSKCGTIVEDNEGRVSAANAPSPLDAAKERRNG